VIMNGKGDNYCQEEDYKPSRKSSAHLIDRNMLFL
jgi:hypothetical protein